MPPGTSGRLGNSRRADTAVAVCLALGGDLDGVCREPTPFDRARGLYDVEVAAAHKCRDVHEVPDKRTGKGQGGVLAARPTLRAQAGGLGK